MSDPLTRTPSGLGAAGKRFWRELTAHYRPEDNAQRALLEAASRAFDRERQASELLARDGLTVTSTNGTVTKHPAVTIELDNRAQVLSALKALGLTAVGKRGVKPGSDKYDEGWRASRNRGR